MIKISLALVISFLAQMLGTQAYACGPDTDCKIGDRHYRIMMPEGHDGLTKVGAIVYAHGYRGSAKGMMKNKSMARLASDIGVALIATKSYSDDWRIPGVPRNTQTDGMIEFSYFDALIDDVTSRFPIDRNELMATGFSAGGMMIWNLACHRSHLFKGFAPMSGTFWEPEPQTCTTPPANIIHIHGDSDPVVPLEGRPIADTHQGQVPQVMKMYSEYGDYQYSGEADFGELKCQMSKNGEGKRLDFCLFPGGHSFKTGFVKHAWEQLIAN